MLVWIVILKGLSTAIKALRFPGTKISGQEKRFLHIQRKGIVKNKMINRSSTTFSVHIPVKFLSPSVRYRLSPSSIGNKLPNNLFSPCEMINLMILLFS